MDLGVYLANILSIFNPFSIDKVPADVLVELAKKHAFEERRRNCHSRNCPKEQMFLWLATSALSEPGKYHLNHF